MRRAFPVADAASIRAAIPHGDVTVEVAVSDLVEVELELERGDAAALSEARIDATQTVLGTEVIVQAKHSGARGFAFGRRAPRYRLRVKCPGGSAFELRSAACDLHAGGELGRVTARTSSGDVSVESVTSLDVVSATGDVSARTVTGDLAVKTTSGDVMAGTVGGVLSVTAVSGDVRVESVGGRSTVSAVSGDVDLGRVAGDVKVHTVSGDVRVVVARGRQLWLDVRSASGDVKSDIEVSDAKTETDLLDPLEVVVQTVSGDVQVRRARS